MLGILVPLLLSANLPAQVEMFTANVNSNASCNESQRTPSNFSDEFHNNCLGFGYTESICNTAWNHFVGAFSNRPPTAVTQGDYGPYFDTIPIESAPNQFVFWSYSYFIAHMLKTFKGMGANVVSSLSNPSSAIVHDIRRTGLRIPNSAELNPRTLCWCSDRGIDGLKMNSDCPMSTSSLFWAEFSKRFGEAASGTVFYIAEGYAPAYRNDSFFVCYELNKFIYPRVTRLVVLNFYSSNSMSRCEDITILERTVRNQSVPNYDCFDLYGNTFNEKDENILAMCALRVINNVQAGTEGKQRHIDCYDQPTNPTQGPNPPNRGNNGAQDVQATVMLVIMNLLMLQLA